MTFRMERLWMMQVIGMTLSFSAILLSGCTSSAYLRDRSRDAGDIFTASCGVGFGGVKARVGPVGTGLLHEFAQYGWRGGDLITPGKMVEGGKVPNGDVQLLVMGGDGFFGTTQNMVRAKSYFAMMRAGINIPLHLSEQWDFPVEKIGEVQGCAPDQVRSSRLAYLTQVEVAGGLFGTLRLGLNLGEMLDFVLGWVGLDIFSDDLEAKNRNMLFKDGTSDWTIVISAPLTPIPEPPLCLRLGQGREKQIPSRRNPPPTTGTGAPRRICHWPKSRHARQEDKPDNTGYETCKSGGAGLCPCAIGIRRRHKAFRRVADLVV